MDTKLLLVVCIPFFAVTGVAMAFLASVRADTLPTFKKIDIQTSSNNSAVRQGCAQPWSTVMGYYQKTWRPISPLGNSNLGIGFSGWADIHTAISESNKVSSSLQGAKYLSVGGGNSHGMFSAQVLKALDSAITSGQLSYYAGIVYDVEGGDSGLKHCFLRSFQVAKNAGFKVLVTISHSAPYAINDRSDLMDAFLASTLIDYISPQLYTSGFETENDYGVTFSYVWQNYVGSVPAVVVSIVNACMYPAAEQYFENIGITLHGYLQWADV